MVDYYLSGVLEARVSGVPVQLGGPKQRCVLAVLLASPGRVVTLDRIIEAVWPDQQPAKALASIRSYVTNLRRALDPASADGVRVVARPHGYQLDLHPEDSVDLARFEELVGAARDALVRGDATSARHQADAALALWRGDPFGEFADLEFARAESVRLASLLTSALEARYDAALQLGGGAELVPEIEAGLIAHPLQERLWGHLMLALHRSGRTADALRAFDRAASVLDAELGTEPGEGLRTLARRIREGTLPAAGGPGGPEVRSPAGPLAALAPLPFVGRDAELAGLDDVVRARASGLLLVTGESGIGKTALVQIAADRARAEGMAVVWASHPAGVRLPLMWTWIQALRRLGGDRDDVGRGLVAAELPGVVDALVPEWNDDPVVRVPATGFALAEGVVRALRVLSVNRPLLLVIDDLQNADDDSIEALLLLAAQVPSLPVQVIATWAYFGADRPMNADAFARLARAGDRRIVHLGGLDSTSGRRLAEAAAEGPLPPEVGARVWSRAAGNPFYVKELARALGTADSGLGTPASVVGVVGRRLAELDDTAQRVLRAAAVIGLEFDVADLADVVELPISVVRSHLLPAHRRGLLDEHDQRPSSYRFGHGLVRDALLVGLSDAGRAEVHAAIAAVRGGRAGTAAYEDALATAEHAWRAGVALDAATGAALIEQVLGRALDRSAYADVAVLCEYGLQASERLPVEPTHLDRQITLWLHLAAAETILEGFAGGSASVAVRRAFEIGQSHRGRGFYSAIAMQCLMDCAHGRIAEADLIARGLRDEYAASGDPDVGLVSDLAQVMSAFLRGEVDELVAVGRHLIHTFAPPELLTDPLHFFHPRVLCWMALGEASRGRAEAAAAHLREASEMGRTHGDVFNQLVTRLTEVECAAILGVVAGTAELAEQVEREFAEAGSEQWAAVARIIAIWARTRTALPDPAGSAAATARQALDDYSFDGTSAMSPLFLCLLADIEQAQGSEDQARQLVARAHRVAEATGEHVWDRQIAERWPGGSQALPPADRPPGRWGRR
ncbi:BTAD domain-containing putative transcriptional regulator [Nocardioides nitrophenolicus]|uniref:BTAD domain-containing putative transcriptional regulator n=1 Tax=Nocardioides nitrophenolicus TaxID=60489 RepID=UPI00195E55D4|nr:BTAD domain-containing putative transcriptional regulator [Nocardioides nitrophenolicus]MBM7517251.1 DNA-binding SARP family transcriptional activator [Nocardioides nitrophenolicus]